MFNFFKKKSNKSEEKVENRVYEKPVDQLARIDSAVLQTLLRDKKILIPSAARGGRMENIKVSVGGSPYMLAANSFEAIERVYNAMIDGKLNGVKLADEYHCMPQVSDFAIQTMNLPYVIQLLNQKKIDYRGLFVYVGDGVDVVSYDELMEINRQESYNCNQDIDCKTMPQSQKDFITICNKMINFGYYDMNKESELLSLAYLIDGMYNQESSDVYRDLITRWNNALDTFIDADQRMHINAVMHAAELAKEMYIRTRKVASNDDNVFNEDVAPILAKCDEIEPQLDAIVEEEIRPSVALFGVIEDDKFAPLWYKEIAVKYLNKNY